MRKMDRPRNISNYSEAIPIGTGIKSVKTHTIDVLHRNELALRDLLRIIDPRNIRMFKFGRCLCLALKAIQDFAAWKKWELQGDSPLKLIVISLPDFAESPSADV